MTNRAPQTTYAYDPVSLGVLNQLPGVHMSHQKLSDVVNASTSQITQTCESNRVILRNGMSYDQFIGGMLFKDEVLISRGKFIYYTNVVFVNVTEPGVIPPKKPSMSNGRLFLTNHRILLLSAEESQGLSLAATGYIGSDKRPTSYTVTGRSSDVLHYQCLPLGCIKSIELNASIGVSSTTTIVGVSPACCLAMWGCCGMEACLKSWFGTNPQTVNLNQRILTLGVTLPPWGHKCMVQIYIAPTDPLQLVRDFIIDLQHFAPDLYTGAMPRKD